MKFDIVHRPGHADTISRDACNALKTMSLHDLHSTPGITRLLHYVKSKHLPFSAEDVKKVVSDCRTCAVCKPRYYRSEATPLIRALRPFDRLSIDFKGPLPVHLEIDTG